jgi:hypothetical protein
MDTCIVETGLLRKKPCGHAAITKCANCEASLCAQHAVPQLSAAQKKTGAFMCKECDDARRQHEKTMASVAKHEQEKKMLAGAKGVVSPAPAKAPAPASAPTAAAQGKAPPAGASEPIPDTIEYRPEPKKK